MFFFVFSALLRFSFGLFEAMSAIELMDPKMDAGMLINQSHSTKIKSFQQAIQVLVDQMSFTAFYV